MGWNSLILAALCGVVMGLAIRESPVEATPTGRVYYAWVTAPTGAADPLSNTWEPVLITCGWHDKCTEGGVNGPALDWAGNSSTGSVVFATVALRQSHQFMSTRVRWGVGWLRPLPSTCDTTEFHVNERVNSTGFMVYRFTMRYTHTAMSVQSGVPADLFVGYGTHKWNHFQVATMIAEPGEASCPWIGPNLSVHDYGYLNPWTGVLPGFRERRWPEPGYIAVMNCPCSNWMNWDWTRYFEWGEGGGY